MTSAGGISVCCTPAGSSFGRLVAHRSTVWVTPSAPGICETPGTLLVAGTDAGDRAAAAAGVRPWAAAGGTPGTAGAAPGAGATAGAAGAAPGTAGAAGAAGATAGRAGAAGAATAAGAAGALPKPDAAWPRMAAGLVGFGGGPGMGSALAVDARPSARPADAKAAIDAPMKTLVIRDILNSNAVSLDVVTGVKRQGNPLRVLLK